MILYRYPLVNHMSKKNKTEINTPSTIKNAILTMPNILSMIIYKRYSPIIYISPNFMVNVNSFRTTKIKIKTNFEISSISLNGFKMLSSILIELVKNLGSFEKALINLPIPPNICSTSISLSGVKCSFSYSLSSCC